MKNIYKGICGGMVPFQAIQIGFVQFGLIIDNLLKHRYTREILKYVLHMYIYIYTYLFIYICVQDGGSAESY